MHNGVCEGLQGKMKVADTMKLKRTRGILVQQCHSLVQRQYNIVQSEKHFHKKPSSAALKAFVAALCGNSCGRCKSTTDSVKQPAWIFYSKAESILRNKVHALLF